MIYMAQPHGITRFYRGQFSLTLRLPNAIRFRRIDVCRASELSKYAEIFGRDLKLFSEILKGTEAASASAQIRS